MYKINIHNRSYKKFDIVDNISLKLSNINNFIPEDHYLLNGDVFNYNENTNRITLIHSMVRNSINIPCVLILNGKTYGKIGNKYLYQAIPHDKRLPIFLVKYLIPSSFKKNPINKYILVSFNSWNNKYNNHPIVNLLNVLGNVDKLDNYYEYILYSKCLNHPIKQFNDDTISKLKNNNLDSLINKITKKYNVIDKTNSNEFIYTIDPKYSLDYDDAFSFIKNENTKKLCIYISNVSLWLDELELWDSFSNRISTIYLPDRKRPMLPNILSDNLCSLLENKRRFAFTLEISFDNNNNITEHKFYNSLINVSKNYNYEDKSLIYNNNYLYILGFINNLNKKHIKLKNEISDSHDLIAYLMICLNYFCSIKLTECKNGIFRTCKINHDLIKENIPNEIKDFIISWRSSRTQYVNYNEDIQHEKLSLDSYVHISSPIRRLIDLLNIIIIQQNLKICNITNKALLFCEKWRNNLDYINTTMRLIRKVQVNCNILHMLTNDPKITDKIYNGYIFEKLEKSDELYVYMIYINELKITARITSRFYFNNYESIKCKIFIILTEENIKKKIRINIIEDE